MQKEFKAIFTAIDKWTKTNKGNVTFVGTFISFDPKKDHEIKDDLIIGYGVKKGAKLAVKELDKLLKEEKGEFINI